MSQRDDQIAESTQYIQESTVVPESMAAHLPDDNTPESAVEFDMDPDNDDGLPGGLAEGLKKPRSGGAGGKKVMVGAIVAAVVFVGGLIVLKKQSVAQQQAQMAAAAEAAHVAEPVAAPTPEPTPTPGPATTPAPIPADQLPQPVPMPPLEAKAGQSPEPADGASGQPQIPTGPAVPQQNGIAANGQPAAAVKEPAQAAPASGASQSNDSVKAQESQAKAAQLQAALLAEQDRARRLEQRLAHLEELMGKGGGGDRTQAQPASKESATEAKAAPAKKSVKKAVKKPVAERDKKKAAKKVKAGPAKAPSSSTVAPEVLAQYHVTAVRNGVAWIDTPTGLTAVRAGDALDSLGTVSTVDEEHGRITVGGHTLR